MKDQRASANLLRTRVTAELDPAECLLGCRYSKGWSFEEPHATLSAGHVLAALCGAVQSSPAHDFKRLATARISSRGLSVSPFF